MLWAYSCWVHIDALHSWCLTTFTHALSEFMLSLHWCFTFMRFDFIYLHSERIHVESTLMFYIHDAWLHLIMLWANSCWVYIEVLHSWGLTSFTYTLSEFMLSPHWCFTFMRFDLIYLRSERIHVESTLMLDIHDVWLHLLVLWVYSCWVHIDVLHSWGLTSFTYGLSELVLSPHW